MAALTQTPSLVSAAVTIPNRILLTGLALTSFAAMLLELALTRVFSVVLFYHFAFLAISIALLGLGGGGVFAHLFKDRFGLWTVRNLATLICAANTVVVPLVLEIVLHVPVSLDISSGNFLRLTVLYLSAAVPFFLTGVLFSVIFGRESRRISRLYGADLVGGSLACLAIVPLLNLIGGPNTILFVAVVESAAVLIWSESKTIRKSASLWGAALIALIALNHSGRWIDVVYAKGMFRDPAWVEFARWNAISRVEVDRQGSAKAIVIDADASTYIMNAEVSKWHDSAWEGDLMSAPPALANVLRPRGAFAIIGPGGGVDVLRAVANGSSSVTGIEINPIIATTVMRERYANYARHLYERPDVHIYVTDGRSYLRSTSERFDVVQMTLVDTWASTAAGAFALSENNLYTTEAFREYFNHLKPDGMIAITRWEFRQPREALRVVSVAMEALHRLGIADPARNFIIASEGALDEDGIPVVVLAKRNAFTREEEAAVKAHLDNNDNLNALYLPSQPGSNPFSDLIARNDAYAFARAYPFNVAPVDDNAPFFFFTLKPGQILDPEGLRQGIDWKNNLGLLVLLLVLGISAAAVLMFLVLPMAIRSGTGSIALIRLLYFVAVGLGYILVEIAFIQRFVLFLGHPTYALTVVIFLLMLSSGAGSLFSRRWIARTGLVWMPLALIALCLIVNVFFLPAWLSALIGLRFGLRVLVSGLLLAPLGFLMGMPFPVGLRAIVGTDGEERGSKPFRAENELPSDRDGNIVEWAWAMNAGASVLGSVLAMVVAIQFGLNVTLALGAAAYISALPLIPAFHRKPS